jgi:hypothetical protein
VAFLAVAFFAVAFFAVAFAVAFFAGTVTPRFAISLVSLITSFEDTSGKRQSIDASSFGEDVDLEIGPRTSNPTQQTNWEAG